jgi:PIN domain nuclease of toxin-antitoxin system
MILDTHIFLWWLFDDSKLSRHLHEIISDPDQRIFVSSASVWEIGTKYRLGKLPEATEVAHNVPQWIINAGFSPLSISTVHAQLAGEWAHNHRDPFDRMLAAQAKIEKIPLATDDAMLKTFDIEIIT